MELKTKWWIAAALVCIAAVVTATMLRNRDTEPVSKPEITVENAGSTVPKHKSKSLAAALGVSEEDMVEVGGVKRPKRDLVETEIDLIQERKEYLAALPKIGRAPLIPNDENPTVAMLAKDLADPKNRFKASSVFSKLEEFDREAYLKNAKAYLEQTRPGRVFQSLPPSKTVAPIEYSSPAFRQIIQGESVFLEAKAEPGMPVTFHTQQLGEFDNRLKTISVAASEEGIAKVKYTAVSGVIGSVRIKAASPVHSGSLVYLVEVAVPQ